MVLKKGVQSGLVPCSVLETTLVIIYHAEKPLQILDRLRSLVLQNGLHSVGVWYNALAGNRVSQKGNLFYAKNAFGNVDGEPIIL